MGTQSTPQPPQSSSHISREGPSVAERLVEELKRQGCTPKDAEPGQWWRAVNRIARADMEPMRKALDGALGENRSKQAFYICIEYLTGPHTFGNLQSTGLYQPVVEALRNFGQDPREILTWEPDPALGNGGLGRLASCFSEAAASLRLPVLFYGLHYDAGLFRQGIDSDGRQTVSPDEWQIDGRDPWAMPRPDHTWQTKLFGRHRQSEDLQNHEWTDAVQLTGMANDVLIASYDGQGGALLRLWTMTAASPTGDGTNDRRLGEINRRLYPPEDAYGKPLRLMQEYFLVSSSLQDIVARHQTTGQPIERLAETTAIQLNDTHPALAVPELIRILVDDHKVPWPDAIRITRDTTFYTNHTLMTEALEKWPEQMFREMLPRHYDIVRGMNNDVHHGILRNGNVNMGDLSAFGTGLTNGVSAMHSILVARDLFPDLEKERGPRAVVNHTNGISQRWLNEANPSLANLLEEKIGTTDFARIKSEAKRLAEDKDFRAVFADIKRSNKLALRSFIESQGGPSFDPDAMIVVQSKRMHTYKRQGLNLLGAIALWHDIRDNPGKERPDQLRIIGGKAFPGFAEAEQSIHMTNWLAKGINADPAVGAKLKLFFTPNYNVSAAQRIIPAADVSQQISTAGTEASGTSNMKFALNGALTVGTRDGANVEIGEEVGEENIFFFGHSKGQLDELNRQGYDPNSFIASSPRLERALRYLETETPFGSFANGIRNGDPWRIAADFVGDPTNAVLGYWDAEERSRELYAKDRDTWTRKTILNMGAGAHFSAARTIAEYADDWGIRPLASPHRPS